MPAAHPRVAQRSTPCLALCAALLLPAALLAPADSAARAPDPALQQAVADPARTPAYAERDAYRRPAETLDFFGIRPGMTVVELWPGGGWYSEILAPYLGPQGRLYAAHFDPEHPRDYFRESRARYAAKLAADPARYGNVELTVFQPPQQVAIAPPGSADAVLTFRNVHNWYMNGAQEGLDAAFAAMYRALKPGGVLGIVDHRLRAERPASAQADSGYMHERAVIAAAERAGFVLEARSEINANPLDSTDHPHGVWTLPPRLRLGEERAEHYLTIGESDRMTLRLRKPAAG